MFFSLSIETFVRQSLLLIAPLHGIYVLSLITYIPTKRLPYFTKTPNCRRLKPFVLNYDTMSCKYFIRS